MSILKRGLVHEVYLQGLEKILDSKYFQPVVSGFLVLFALKALEKNQQWLIYDQQREAYVRSILARVSELEQQLEAFKLEQAKESRTEGIDLTPSYEQN